MARSGNSHDYYETLGVPRTATAEQIKKAYKKLARKYHPDLNPGNKAAEERFKRISEAYSILGDDEKRSKYDRFGTADAPNIDWASAARGAGFGGTPEWAEILRNFETRTARPGAGRPAGGPTGGFGFGGFEEVFADLFGTRRGRRKESAAGRDVEVEVEIPFLLAVKGGVRAVAVDVEGRREQIHLKIPPGLKDGTRLKIPGRGAEAEPGGARGDLYLKAKIAPHDVLRREDDDLHFDLPVTFAEVALGATIEVPTLGGLRRLKIPAGTQGGQRLRIAGEGVPRRDGTKGDLYVQLQIVVPKELDAESRRRVQEVDRAHPLDPRAGLARTFDIP